MLKKLLISLTSGLLTVAGVLFYSTWGIPMPMRALLLPWVYSNPLGFEATWQLEPTRDGVLGCGSGGGPTSCRWIDGPRGRFDERDPAELARISLNWFLHSKSADLWNSAYEQRLVLTYPSAGRRVRVRHDPEVGIPWEEQLTAWFDRFPPTADAYRDRHSDGDFQWTVTFGERGEVRSWTASADAALAAMRSTVDGLADHRSFGRPNFDLHRMARVNETKGDGYSVYTDDPGEVDRLPERLEARMTYVSSKSSRSRDEQRPRRR